MDWLRDKAAAEAQAHRKELEEGLDRMSKASAEEQAKWWDSLSAEDKKYLIDGEGKDGPFAKADIPVYKETGSAKVEARVLWVHGGAEMGTGVVENADGSATMKVHGILGLGVNEASGSVGDVKDVAGNPPGYILDTIDDAAGGNGATGHEDKANGTLSLEVKGESGDASGSAKLDLAYEKNMTGHRED
ncbi:hypothetical protein [Pseudarthrobacter sp. N5]|uniref:hypothetical protein n=1 Tax=Pseudarthrobacter sp. N5 TaxID=3418416 RepID=UPI003CEA423F